MKKRSKKTLKKLFIPHSDNNFKPKFFENKAVFVFSAFVILLFIFSVNISDILRNVAKNSQLSAVLPSVLIELTNEERVSVSLNSLKENELLGRAAQLKAEDMAAKSYFSHINPDGKRAWNWLQDVGYKYQYAGENLAVNFSESENITVAWMNSPTHKANILKSAYTEIGTGVANGKFNGVNSIFVAQVYGNPYTGVVNNQANVIDSVNFATDPVKDFFSYLLYSNHDLTNKIFIGLLIFVVIALTLTIFIKFKIQYRHLIRNALIVCTLIIILILINKFMEKSKLQDLEYSSTEYYLNQNGQNITKY